MLYKDTWAEWQATSIENLPIRTKIGSGEPRRSEINIGELLAGFLALFDHGWYICIEDLASGIGV